MLRILDHILPSDTSDDIADVNHAAFVQAHGHLLSPEALARCTREFSRTEWAKFPNPKATYGFAYLDNLLVGFTVFSKCRVAGLESHAEMRSLYVHPDHQGKGVGKALKEWGFEMMRATANGRVYLEVLKGNSSREFYAHTGAQHVTSDARNIFGDVLDTEVMCYTLV